MKKNKKAGLFLVSLFCLAALAGGCETLPKKFIRKKKEPAHTPAVVYLEEGPTQKKFSNAYYYKSHFTFWKTWHDELSNRLGGNRKKAARTAQETLGHLTDMNRYLVPEKQKELEPLIQNVRRLVQDIENGRDLGPQQGPIKVEIERTQRLIANDFTYDKVKDFIEPDVVDLSPGRGKVSE
ncbi:MAG: hypothetical protein HY593_00690 [Candidatus Omnitrophica bacterium]|nr:hypothetical protein [Candidatus Omnitrophota bacterium]